AVEAAEAVAAYRRTHLARDRQPQPQGRQPVLAGVHQDPLVPGGAAAGVNAPEIRPAAQGLGGGGAGGGRAGPGGPRRPARPARGFVGCSRANSSKSSRLRGSRAAGTMTRASMYWSPPLIPLPRNRRRDPLDVPGGILTLRRSPSRVGTSTVAPRAASV